MAYFAFYLVSRLHLYSPWRQPPSSLSKHHDYFFAQRFMAWRQLDICGVGRTAWFIYGCFGKNTFAERKFIDTKGYFSNGSKHPCNLFISAIRMDIFPRQ